MSESLPGTQPTECEPLVSTQTRVFGAEMQPVVQLDAIGEGGATTATKSAASIRGLLHQFSQRTTAHGLGRLGAQRDVLGSVVWLAFLVPTYCGLAYHMYTLFDRFTAVPLLTGLSTSLPFEFPDVYFCPSSVLSMSKIAETYSQQEVQQLRGLKKSCNLSCQRNLSKFDIESGGKPVRLSRVMLALSDTLAATEESLIGTYKLNYMRSQNLTECRCTPPGEDFAGGANTVPVYGDSNLGIGGDSAAALPDRPYVTRRPCMSWNDAARRLSGAGVAPAAAILALNYSDSEARCRQPPGLPLSKFYDFATYPIRKEVGCFQFIVNTTSGPLDYYCFNEVSPFNMSIDICTECCYNRNFSYIGLQDFDCICYDLLDRLSTVSKACNIFCSGNESQICGGEADISVYMVRPLGSKPLFIPYGNYLTSLFEGPYCFYMDPGERLSAFYCSIPFCSSPPEYDCSVSDIDGDKGRRQLASYSGHLNSTGKGHRCMAWQSVQEHVQNGSLRLWDVPQVWEPGEVKDFKVKRMHIETPDYSLSSRSNYCRAARVISDTVYEMNTGRFFFIRDAIINSIVPGCFYLNEVDNGVYFERCEVPPCYQSSPSVTSAIRDRVGSAPLTRQFSGGLTVGFTDCAFAGKRCTRNDFVNVEHPELGVCHRFVKETFLKQLTSSQVAEASLQLKYFTDSSDSLGRRFSNTSKMASAVHKRLEMPDAGSAMLVLVVPSGTFPWMTGGISVSPAQNTKVLLRFDKTTRLTKPAQPCLQSVSPVTYALHLWHPAVSKESTLSSHTFDAVFAATVWHDKIDRLKNLLSNLSALKGPVNSSIEFKSVTQDDCINAYLVRKFISNCACLPSFLPIPVQLAKSHRRCFNQTDADSLYLAERCYMQQIGNIESYRMDARAECPPPCETHSYTIREASHPWPNVKRERALSFLAELAGMHGYPNDVTSTRGPVSLYYAYLRALELSRVALSSRNLADVVDFAYELDIVQDRLAMVTVKAAQAFGEEIVEEEAYPVKNLLADMGGALGLWCGVSVLTICEVLELCSFLAVALRRRLTAPVRQEATEPEVAVNPEVDAQSHSLS